MWLVSVVIAILINDMVYVFSLIGGLFAVPMIVRFILIVDPSASIVIIGVGGHWFCSQVR